MSQQSQKQGMKTWKKVLLWAVGIYAALMVIALLIDDTEEESSTSSGVSLTTQQKQYVSNSYDRRRSEVLTQAANCPDKSVYRRINQYEPNDAMKGLVQLERFQAELEDKGC